MDTGAFRLVLQTGRSRKTDTAHWLLSFARLLKVNTI